MISPVDIGNPIEFDGIKWRRAKSIAFDRFKRKREALAGVVVRLSAREQGGGVGANPCVSPNSEGGQAQEPAPTEYRDTSGLCWSASTDEIREHGYVLTPGRLWGAAEIEGDGIPFEEKMAERSATLYEQFSEADRLDLPAEASAQAGATIKRNLEVLGYGG